MMELVRRQVDRLERMVGDLLDASRIEAGRLELRLGGATCAHLVREVVELYGPVSAAHPLRMVMPSLAVWVRCDPTHIEQVVGKLVSNAIQYSPEGGEVGISPKAKDGMALLEVCATGARGSRRITWGESPSPSSAAARPAGGSRVCGWDSRSPRESSRRTAGASRWSRRRESARSFACCSS
jgi:hypothetical protein